MTGRFACPKADYKVEGCVSPNNKSGSSNHFLTSSYCLTRPEKHVKALVAIRRVEAFPMRI